MFILVGGNVWLHFFLSLITPACPTFLYLLASIYIASETSTYCLCVDIVLPLCRVQKHQLWVISSFANHAEIAEKIKFRNRVHAEKTTLWILKVRRQLISFLVFCLVLRKTPLTKHFGPVRVGCSNLWILCSWLYAIFSCQNEHSRLCTLYCQWFITCLCLPIG